MEDACLLYPAYVHTLVQLNVGEMSPAVLVKPCFPQILTVLSPHAADSEWCQGKFA